MRRRGKQAYSSARGRHPVVDDRVVHAARDRAVQHDLFVHAASTNDSLDRPHCQPANFRYSATG